MFEKIAKIMADQLGCDQGKIKENTDLMKDLGADSLDIVEMLMKLEEEFGITVSDEQAAELKTVGDIVKYIESQKK